MTKPNASGQSHRYVRIEFPHSIIMPIDEGMEVFKALCVAEAVSYDWQDKSYKRTEHQPSLHVFSLADYAKLSLT